MNQTVFYQNFSFFEYRFRYAHYTDMRCGAPMHYLAQMKTGRARVVGTDARIEIGEGDVFFIPKGLQYQSYWEGDDEVVWNSYGFPYFPEAESSTPLLQKIVCTKEEENLLSLLDQDKSPSSLTIGRFYTLLAALLPHMEAEPRTAAESVYDCAAACLRADPRMSASELAAACSMSESGLYALFSRSFHTTPNALRHRILAEKATELLENTDLSVEEISTRLGFSSSSYFRKILRRETDRTPTEIRRNAPF